MKRREIHSNKINRISNTKNRTFAIELALSIAFLLLSFLAIFLSLNYVNSLPQSRPLPDAMHDIFSFSYIYSVIAELFMLLVIILFIAYIIKKKKYYEIPFYLTCLGIFYFLRAIIFLLIPLQNPYPLHDFGLFYNILPQGGMFPSGHAGFVFILFLFISNKDRIIKYALLSLAFLTGFFMIISRGHYTIDVIGGIVISYTVYCVMKYIWRRKKKNL